MSKKRNLYGRPSPLWYYRLEDYPEWEIGFYRYITHLVFQLYSTSLEIWEWKFIRRFKRKNRTINEIKKQILC